MIQQSIRYGSSAFQRLWIDISQWTSLSSLTPLRQRIIKTFQYYFECRWHILRQAYTIQQDGARLLHAVRHWWTNDRRIFCFLSFPFPIHNSRWTAPIDCNRNDFAYIFFSLNHFRSPVLFIYGCDFKCWLFNSINANALGASSMCFADAHRWRLEHARRWMPEPTTRASITTKCTTATTRAQEK